MKKSYQLLVCAIAFNLFTGVYASQTIYGEHAAQIVSGARQITTSEFSALPDLIIFEESKQPIFGDPELWTRMTFGLSKDYGLKILTVDPDQIGFTHYRYQQTLNGYPLDGTMWLIHVKDGKVVSMNGLLFNTVKLINQPSLSETDALAKALAFVNASSYKWQNPEEENALREIMDDPAATYYPKGELMFARDTRKQNFNYRLSYRFDIYAHEPMSRQYIFVDANSGEISDIQDRIWEVNRTGTAVTAYAGTQTIVADSTSNSYRLREAGRGAGLGVETYNLQKTTTYTNTDFTDADNYWNNVNANKDQYAGDCHFAAEKTYDYFYNTYGRNSINNAGLKLISYVHYGTNYVNAFWNGSYMTYGDGNATYNPLTSIDIGGHEITHGLTSYTANLVYSYESGALNESFSDCFGTTIEWYADPVHGDWLMGEDIGAAFRSHSNPNAYGDPDTYLGTNWYTGTGDNGGVHTNSGVQNYWYYLLANGGSGTNDIGNAFNVTGISLTKAAAIAFRTLTVYLTSSSNYANARTYSIQSATDLYGACSPEVIQTANAWYAVGIGAQGSGGPSTVTATGLTTICNGSSVTLNSSSIAGSTYQWNRNGTPISGATTTTYSASLAGTYTMTTTGCGASTYTSNSIVVSTVSVSSTISPAGTASGCTNILLTAGGTAGYGYQWNESGLPISGATNSTYSAPASGSYTLTLLAATFPNQNFSSTSTSSIPDNTCTNPAINTINVAGYNGVVNSAGITCTVNITHTYDGDINFMLEAPNGDVIGLSNFAGGAGDNFINTVFSDAGTITVANGTAPFTGTFKPWQSLITSCTNSNKIGFGAIGGGTINPNGAWKLRVYDRYSTDVGTINSWSISFPAYTVPNPNCGPVTSSVTAVTIGPISVSAGTYSPVCVGASPITLAGSPAGGTFSGPGVTGNVFDPGVGSGNYNITYSYTDGNGCSNTNSTSITVNALPNVSAGTYPQVCSNAGLITLIGTPSGGTWSGTGVTGNSFDPSIGDGTYALTYSYTDVNGCSNSETAFQKVNALPVVTAGSYPGACDKSANITLNGSPAGGTWSGTGISGSTFVTASVNPGSYPVVYSYTDINGCSNSSSATIIVNALPIVTASNVSGCAGSSIALTGSPSGGSWSLANPYTGPDASYTYTYTDGNGCTNTSGAASIIVNPLPTVSFSGLSATYDVSASSSTLTGAPAGGTFSGPGVTGNSFSPSSAGVGGPYTITYSYTDGNGCSNSYSLQTNVTNCIAPAQPGTITATGGNSKVCPGDSKIYSIAAVGGASSYTWTAPAGATIASGQGTTSITVNYTAAFTASGTLSVISNSICGSSIAKTLAITRNNPSTPAPISGASSAVCPGTSGTYSVTNVAGVSYNWVAPSNASITGGQGTNTVTLSFTGSFTSGSLSVTASNNCGTSIARSLNVISIPNRPGTISGLASSACASTTGTYSVINVAGVTYNWTAPANASIQSGQGTNSVVVNFSGAFTSGTLSVVGSNACGSSIARTLAIASVPARPASITGSLTNLCNATGIPYSTPAVANATGYNWTIPAASSFVTNNGTSISLDYGAMVSGQICVTSANLCGNSASRCVTVSGKPATPSVVSGPASVCANQNGISYSCATQSGATYTWTVPAGSTIVSGQGTGNITVNWGISGGTVKVTPSNACGISSTRSLVVTITCREAISHVANSSFIIVPNPASDYTVCEYNTSASGRITIVLSDLTGRMLDQFTHNVAEGNNRIDLNISSLAKGIYLVSIRAEDNSVSTKKLAIE